MSRGWIGVDLDGTLAYYDGWAGIDNIGAPIPLMQQRVMDWHKNGHEIKIFTARVSGSESEDARAAIKDWLSVHGFPSFEITNVKDFGMIELYDDRAVQVKPNTGILVGKSTRGLI